jgi:hypothetical protein
MFVDASRNSTFNFLCVATNRSDNCSLPALPPEEYFE